MQNKKRIPLMVGGIIQREREIADANSISARRIALVERTGKMKRLVLRKPKNFFPNELAAISYQKKWLKLKKAGLPVPWYSKVDLRKKSATRLGIFQPDLKRRYGELIPINKDQWEHRGHQCFLKQLHLGKDRKVIGELAADLAKLHELNYSCFWVDFWHFYKKGNSYGRLIFDLENLYKINKKEDAPNQARHIINVFSELEQYFGENEFLYFVRQYCKHCKYKPRAEFVFDMYIPKPPEHYSYEGYLKAIREEKLHPKGQKPLFV